MNTLNKIINFLLIISIISVALILLDFFTGIFFNGPNIIGSKVPNSLDEYFVLGPLILLFISLVAKIFMKIYFSKKIENSGYEAMTTTKSNKINWLIAIGLFILSASIHTVYLFFVGMSCGFGYDKFFCNLMFPAIIVGFIVSVGMGIVISKKPTPKKIVLYVLANIFAVIFAFLIDSNYFNI